jgi:RNA polymerase sigma factor (sigma-70 family)
MTTRRVEDFAPQLRSLLALGSLQNLTDGQLLGRFEGGDAEASGLAFEALVERHGSMVLRVCRGVLRDPHDAQDAFQATFLVLVRRAGSIRDRDSLASWLHGVALRVAAHARAGEARRRRLERSAVERVGSPSVDGAADDLGPKLHEEVGRLPDRYRAAVVLCYLEGHTCEEAARVLRWPVGTVKSRLSRARERLRARLTRLGLAPAFALAMPADPPRVAPLPHRLVKATAELAGRFGARSSAPAAAFGAVALAEGVLKYPAIALLAASWPVIASALTPPGAILDPPKAQAPPAEVAPQDAPEKPKQPVGDRRGIKRPEAPEEPNAKGQAPDPIDLTVPQHLSARAGSGKALMYALDARKERIVDEDAANAGARMDAIRAMIKAIKKDGKDLEDALALPNRPEALRSIANAVQKDGKDLEDALAVHDGPWKEVETDLRWVVVTGVVDNRKFREAAAQIRKGDPADVFPNYKRVDVQRQVRRPDGNWSDWMDEDANKNYEILDNLPELSPERLPDEVRLGALVDPLPLLKKGSWSEVDPEPLLRLPKPGPDRVSADGRRPLPRLPLLPRPNSPLLAIRSLDFTVEPGSTYRYRVRVVVWDPIANEGGKKERRGPWCGPTGHVAVP